MKKKEERRRKERFSSVYAIARAYIEDYYAGGSKCFESLEVFHRGKWLSLGIPKTWLSAKDWKELNKEDKTKIFACEIMDRLEKYEFEIKGVPAEYKG